MSDQIRPQLTHAGLNVYDLDTMRRFYTEVMGLIETDSGRGKTFAGEFVFLSADPTRHHQFALASGRAPDSPHSTVNQISFTVRNLDELRTMYRPIASGQIVSNAHHRQTAMVVVDSRRRSLAVTADRGPPLDQHPNSNLYRWRSLPPAPLLDV